MYQEMENRCPVCGRMVQAGVSACPGCGLEGLNQQFLSREGYEKWVREVLEPYKAAIAPRVFAGNGFGLVLTPKGKLYGFGNNHSCQIDDGEAECYEAPVLIAQDVIHAAAGDGLTAYVTRDGWLHWQSQGSEGLPELSDVREVYMQSWIPRVWVVKNHGEVLVFGKNHDGELEEPSQTVFDMPEMAGFRDKYGTGIRWVDDDTVSQSVSDHIVRSELYQQLCDRYGEGNLKLELNGVRVDRALKARYSAYFKDLVVYRPKIYVTNAHIYDPIPWRKPMLTELPHRYYSRPLLPEEYQGKAAQVSGVKKVFASGGFGSFLALQSDGSVLTAGGKTLDWQKVPVLDLAYGSETFVFACGNGDIVWCHDAKWEDSVWTRLEKGRVNTLRLPEDESDVT